MFVIKLNILIQNHCSMILVLLSEIVMRLHVKSPTERVYVRFHKKSALCDFFGYVKKNKINTLTHRRNNTKNYIRLKKKSMYYVSGYHLPCADGTHNTIV